LYRLAGSARHWDRRVAIIATFHFIKHGDFTDTLNLASRFLKDPEDLMHKAVGWMLREVGKQDQRVLEDFLTIHAHQMPRTMLRYAIERLSERKRQFYFKPRNSSWITKVRASSWRTWQNKKMSHHHKGDHEIFYFTMHTNIFHVCFAPNCRF